MAFLVHNLPPIQCYVKREFLYDFEKGFGEYEPCIWMTIKCIKGKLTKKVSGKNPKCPSGYKRA